MPFCYSSINTYNWLCLHSVQAEENSHSRAQLTHPTYVYRVSTTNTNLAYTDEAVMCSLSSPLLGEQKRIQIKKGNSIAKITYNKGVHKICCISAHTKYKRILRY